MFDINELLSKRNQRDALKYFDKKHRTRGSTSATSDFECYWTIDGSRIVDSIKNEKLSYVDKDQIGTTKEDNNII